MLDGLSPEGWAHLHARVIGSAAPATRPLGREDWLTALVIWSLVFGATLPLVVPYLLIDTPATALRTSQGVAVLMMFLLGTRLAHWIGTAPWRTGLGFALLGSVIAAICIALGG